MLELLECPVCHRDMALTVATLDGDRVREGERRCAQRPCFPIREYVPIFAGSEPYVEAFSALRQSNRAVPDLPSRGPQLDVRALTRDEFWRQTQIHPEDLRGTIALDAGCGDGRWGTSA